MLGWFKLRVSWLYITWFLPHTTTTNQKLKTSKPSNKKNTKNNPQTKNQINQF
jgi:hypothetical protein